MRSTMESVAATAPTVSSEVHGKRGTTPGGGAPRHAAATSGRASYVNPLIGVARLRSERRDPGPDDEGRFPLAGTDVAGATLAVGPVRECAGGQGDGRLAVVGHGDGQVVLTGGATVSLLPPVDADRAALGPLRSPGGGQPRARRLDVYRGGADAARRDAEQASGHGIGADRTPPVGEAFRACLGNRAAGALDVVVGDVVARLSSGRPTAGIPLLPQRGAPLVQDLRGPVARRAGQQAEQRGRLVGFDQRQFEVTQVHRALFHPLGGEVSTEFRERRG